ncbi:MAG: TIGR00304 family membrane protein [Candidatus Bathycorpusculaceae bacterium]
MIDAETLYALGASLVFVGIAILILALLLLTISSVKEGRARGGGAIIIGPLPIIFGTDRKSLRTVLLLSLILTILLIIAMVISYLLK